MFKIKSVWSNQLFQTDLNIKERNIHSSISRKSTRSPKCLFQIYHLPIPSVFSTLHFLFEDLKVLHMQTDLDMFWNIFTHYPQRKLFFRVFCLIKQTDTSRSPLVMDSSSTLNWRSSTFLSWHTMTTRCQNILQIQEQSFKGEAHFFAMF